MNSASRQRAPTLTAAFQRVTSRRHGRGHGTLVSHSTDLGCISEGDESEEETAFSRNCDIADGNICKCSSHYYTRSIRAGCSALVQLVYCPDMLALARQWAQIIWSWMHWPQRHAIGLHRRTQGSSI